MDSLMKDGKEYKLLPPTYEAVERESNAKYRSSGLDSIFDQICPSTSLERRMIWLLNKSRSSSLILETVETSGVQGFNKEDTWAKITPCDMPIVLMQSNYNPFSSAGRE